MIVRILKLQPNAKQESKLGEWLWCLTGLYNWGIKKIENDFRDSVYHSSFDFVNLVANHSRRMEIPSHTMQGVLSQAYGAWQRCFKKKAGKPHLKGQRNKFNSIPFPDPFKRPPKNRVAIPGLGSVRFHKQELPEVKIKCGRIVKRASGWYLCLWLDCDHVFPVQVTNRAVGIDPGFHTLLTFSDGTKIENPRELRNGEQRIAQAQRGNRKQLAARLQERQANRRRDRNHKISRKLVEQYRTICYSDDNLKGMAHKFGKSVSEAGLKQLVNMLAYKCRIGGRELIPVASFGTTMICSTCGSVSGPRGLSGLAVRQWDCACGAHHDRDINAAKNVLFVGLGTSHERRRNVA
jgi:IS605 OrfB family transposase